MSEREVVFFLDDILEGIGFIEEYTHGLSEEEFPADRKTFDAVIRNLEVISEACSNIPAHLREQYAQIPWRKIVGLRNVVIHHYFGVDPGTVCLVYRHQATPWIET
ncbi:uncharacterized protein with HEPN domain [Methanofollis sp. W23]|uniref:HepT-like ribonuclease domain-containing protein n=1 Tax=Methanofollis sp. W23 TaxID=2817849 RepID=UPI001DF1C8A4|nr:DUF86 domain-containing protein [Methanofollis sp. W23]MBP2144653.1 uncharacterized protein with HEPN domain [Methanofollis sp. W23]